MNDQIIKFEITSLRKLLAVNSEETIMAALKSPYLTVISELPKMRTTWFMPASFQYLRDDKFAVVLVDASKRAIKMQAISGFMVI